MAAFLAAAVVVSVYLGRKEHPPAAVGGFYSASGASCFGGNFKLIQSGQFVDLQGSGKVGGKLRLRKGVLAGTSTCSAGGHADVHLQLSGPATHRMLVGTVGGRTFTAKFTASLPEPGASAKAGEEAFR